MYFLSLLGNSVCDNMIKTSNFMRIFLFLAISFYGLTCALGQSQNQKSYVIQDENVDKLIKMYRQTNLSKGMQGFRVQIYSVSGNRSKLLTDREKAIFDAVFSAVRSYIRYDEPYYKLRVGDFRTRLEAERFMREISSRYVFSLVVPDRINPPRLPIDLTSEGN